VSIRVADWQTKDSISLTSFLYCVSPARESGNMVPLAGISPLNPRNPIELNVPRGVLNLQVTAKGYGERRFQIDTANDRSPLLLIAGESCIRLRTAAFGGPRPLDEAWWKSIRVEAWDAAAGEYLLLEFGAFSALHETSDARFIVSRPGRYRLTYPPPCGVEAGNTSVECAAVYAGTGGDASPAQTLDLTPLFLSRAP
jgi:hypothetical protein